MDVGGDRPEIQPYGRQNVRHYLQTEARNWYGFFHPVDDVEEYAFQGHYLATQDTLNTWAMRMSSIGTAYPPQLDVITTVHSRDVTMLSGFISADELWRGYLLPSGRFLLGPETQLLKAMRECIADGTLDDYRGAYAATVSELINSLGADVPREWRRKALHMFYKSMLHDSSDFCEHNARHHGLYWAKDFGLHPADITALPWF